MQTEDKTPKSNESSQTQKKAGVHPLAALGSSVSAGYGHNFNVRSVGNYIDMGRDIGSALQPRQRSQPKLQQRALENAELKNDALRAQIAQSGAHTRQMLQSATSRTLVQKAVNDTRGGQPFKFPGLRPQILISLLLKHSRTIGVWPWDWFAAAVNPVADIGHIVGNKIDSSSRIIYIMELLMFCGVRYYCSGHYQASNAVRRVLNFNHQTIIGWRHMIRCLLLHRVIIHIDMQIGQISACRLKARNPVQRI